MTRMQVLFVTAAMLLALALVLPSASAGVIPASKEADFLDWLMENYRESQALGGPDKRGAWTSKARGCNPMYDWNCNNPMGRVGRR